MNWLKIVIKYLPVVLSGVRAVEESVGSSKGQGATKKQIVLDAIRAGATVGATVPDDHVAGISQLVDAVVGTLNATKALGFGK